MTTSEPNVHQKALIIRRHWMYLLSFLNTSWTSSSVIPRERRLASSRRRKAEELQSQQPPLCRKHVVHVVGMLSHFNVDLSCCQGFVRRLRGCSLAWCFVTCYVLRMLRGAVTWRTAGNNLKIAFLNLVYFLFSTGTRNFSTSTIPVQYLVPGLVQQ